MGGPKVIVVGAGGHGRVVMDILLSCRNLGASLEPIGFVDDSIAVGTPIMQEMRILGATTDLIRIVHDAVVVAIGDNRMRMSICSHMESLGIKLFTAIHPFSSIAIDVRERVGSGSVICAGAVICTGAIIGKYVIVNTGASVDHDCVLADGVHVAPGARLTGSVCLGEGTFVGSNACIIPGVRIGDWATIGAGAAVTQNVPPARTAVGVPARLTVR